MTEQQGGGTAAGQFNVVPKQAVIVVHGMGEQRPLETLREFVEGVYGENPSVSGAEDIKLQQVLGAKEEDEDSAPADNMVWIVPDKATGSAELRRISTPKNSANIRTDFFEFYWADVMDGTPLELLFDWLQGLLLRSPANVPPRVRVILAWLLLWAVAGVTVVMAIFGAAPNSEIFKPATDALGHFFTDNRTWVTLVLVGLGIIVLLLRMSSARTAAEIKLSLSVLLIALGLVVYFAPPQMFNQPTLWAWLVTFLGAAFFTKLVGPYVGDVARYSRATPATIEKRRIIRARGLQLLRDIHAKVGTDGLPEYDRIVLVGHSLGTFIAYDLLLQYWAEDGPSHRSMLPGGSLWKSEKPVVEALRKIDEFTKQVWPMPGCDPVDAGFNKAAHRDAQGEAFSALARSELKWRISDFVTLGSPLTHADFLLVDGAAPLEKAFGERLFASSPPRPDWPNPSMLYMDWAGLRGPFAHFAAPFAAVRWTNIYDEHWFPLIGDIVSGPLARCFGPGVEQVPVTMRRAGRPPLINRIFTHTLYWRWQKGYESPSPPHILALRKALDLAGPTAQHTRVFVPGKPQTSQGPSR
jgi:hypothetical protein